MFDIFVSCHFIVFNPVCCECEFIFHSVFAVHVSNDNDGFHSVKKKILVVGSSFYFMNLLIQVALRYFYGNSLKACYMMAMCRLKQNSRFDFSHVVYFHHFTVVSFSRHDKLQESSRVADRMHNRIMEKSLIR